MLHRLVGAQEFRAALDGNFRRQRRAGLHHRGLAGRVRDVASRDLSQFKRWYTQAGHARAVGQLGGRGDTPAPHLRQEVPEPPTSR